MGSRHAARVLTSGRLFLSLELENGSWNLEGPRPVAQSTSESAKLTKGDCAQDLKRVCEPQTLPRTTFQAGG